MSPDERELEGWVTSEGVMRALAHRVAGPAEITIDDGSPAAGRKLGDVNWPPSGIPVLMLRGGSSRPLHPGSTMVPGDRVSLLVPAPDHG